MSLVIDMSDVLAVKTKKRWLVGLYLSSNSSRSFQ